jgi:hypothetical protein
MAQFDSNGLCDLAIDGGHGDQDCPSDELMAIVADLWPAKYPRPSCLEE